MFPCSFQLPETAPYLGVWPLPLSVCVLVLAEAQALWLWLTGLVAPQYVGA